ncbi:MAG: methionine gamma-lyase family protein [Clostridia bacterium]|nr:methionine gamma-lyase family protein [Clostridia bacterium]
MKYNSFDFSEKIISLADRAQKLLRPVFEKIDSVAEYNSQKVLRAFIDCRVAETHFAASTGYGYGDAGRDVLDAVFAKAVGAEDALVRHHFVSGTHTLSVALFGLLRAGDTLLSVTGKPYDTMEEVIGIRGDGNGSLKDFGISYRQVDLRDGRPDLSAIRSAAADRKIRVAYFQRSRGYELRPSLSVAQIAEAIKVIRSVNSDCYIMIDNCYGEFVEIDEPVSYGADIIAGSLIKNAGGGIAPCGGYIAGSARAVEKCSYSLTTVGTGREVGASLGHNRELFMGLFNAPHVVGEALKTAAFTAAMANALGFRAFPAFDEPRTDIIQSVCLENSENLLKFCRGIQSCSPVDSFAAPEPWAMPGYESEVIMAAGAFTNGASIEISADAPLREPYAVWLQGGLNYHTAKIAVMKAFDNLSV